MKRYVLLFPLFISISSCNIKFVNENEFYDRDNPVINSGVPVHENIRVKAWDSAINYVQNSVPYEWGGDYYIEPTRSSGVDCSGLIINNYKYALKGSSYKLKFDDSTAHELYLKYTNPVTIPEKGDLIFWKNKENRIYHVALFEKRVGDKYYYIDSTQTGDTDGVSYRFSYISTVYTVKRLLVE